MKIGIIREGKTPPDKRVALSPDQCEQIQQDYPEVEIIVQRSPIRTFEDSVYEAKGMRLVGADEIGEADVLLGVKEVPIPQLIPNKTYFFFSHTIKEQPYNRELLKSMLAQNIRMIDYECLTDGKKRLIGFGRYAGIVGCYNGLLAYGQRSGAYQLKAAHTCYDRKEMEGELPKIELPKGFKIVLTGAGRVAGGAMEILDQMGVRKVSPEAYLQQSFDEPVYAQLLVTDYNRKPDGSAFERKEFYQHPERFESDFYRFAKQTDLFIPCHYWDANSPFLFTRAQAASADFRIRTVADISCDIDGPVASTIRPSTIADPIYQYNRMTQEETKAISDESITVMAVDNLPCELPKDASEDFGNEFMKHILPSLLNEDQDEILKRATIANQGALTAEFSYLQAYVDGTN